MIVDSVEKNRSKLKDNPILYLDLEHETIEYLQAIIGHAHLISRKHAKVV